MKKPAQPTGAADTAANLNDFQAASRARFDENIQMVSDSIKPALGHLRALVDDLRASPLGKKAKDNPLAAVAIISVGALLMSKLFKR
jgi:hypothetical protein